ncbi:MAG: hypothetical protein ABH840_04100 [Nanoarchaeota archaeon]
MKRLLCSLIAAGSFFLNGCVNEQMFMHEGEVMARSYTPAQSGVNHVPFVLPFGRGILAGVVRNEYHIPDQYQIVVENHTKTEVQRDTFNVPREVYDGAYWEGTWFAPVTSQEYDMFMNASKK